MIALALEDYKYNSCYTLQSGTKVAGLDVKGMAYHTSGRGARWTDSSKAILLGIYVKRRNMYRTTEEFEVITGHKISHSQVYHILFRFHQRQEMFGEHPRNMIYKHTPQCESKASMIIAAIDKDPTLLAKGYKHIAYKLQVKHSVVKYAIYEKQRRAKRVHT